MPPSLLYKTIGMPPFPEGDGGCLCMWYTDSKA